MRLATRRLPSSRRGPGHGFTLLEVLVAVIVLSFGVLGVVGLQAASLQANRDARLQSSAARLGRELADLMRSNKDISLLTTAAANPYLVDFSGAIPAAARDCYANTCSTLEVAQWQMRDWLTRVADEMPGAHVVTCFDATPYNATGQPRWNCDGDLAQVVIKIGWNQLSTDRSQQGVARLDRATLPMVMLPLTPGRS